MKTIENNPDVLNGVLVFEGTRVPVRNLFDYLVAGESVKDFLEDFPTVSHLYHQSPHKTPNLGLQ